LKLMKKEGRILGISDGFPRHESMRSMLQVVGVVFRGAYWLEGVMRTVIQRNGWNATSQLERMIRSSPHFQQMRILMTDGLAFAGLNIINIKILNERTGIPVIAVSRERQELESLSEAVKGMERHRFRKSALKAAGQAVPIQLTPARKPVFLHYSGIDLSEVKGIMKRVCTTEIPEPIRVARIFSSVFNRFIIRRIQKD
jgi:endonuclease V-like protein UPF0215 family